MANRKQIAVFVGTNYKPYKEVCLDMVMWHLNKLSKKHDITLFVSKQTHMRNFQNKYVFKVRFPIVDISAGLTGKNFIHDDTGKFERNEIYVDGNECFGDYEPDEIYFINCYAKGFKMEQIGKNIDVDTEKYKLKSKTSFVSYHTMLNVFVPGLLLMLKYPKAKVTTLMFDLEGDLVIDGAKNYCFIPIEGFEYLPLFRNYNDAVIKDKFWPHFKRKSHDWSFGYTATNVQRQHYHECFGTLYYELQIYSKGIEFFGKDKYWPDSPLIIVPEKQMCVSQAISRNTFITPSYASGKEWKKKAPLNMYRVYQALACNCMPIFLTDKGRKLPLPDWVPVYDIESVTAKELYDNMPDRKVYKRKLKEFFWDDDAIKKEFDKLKNL